MLQHYLAYAFKNIRRQKMASLINVVGLTLGVACFVLASVLTSFLGSADKHYANADRIYIVQQKNETPGDATSAVFFPGAAPSLAKYLRLDFPQLEAVARTIMRGWELVGVNDKRYGASILYADPDLLKIFDLRFAAGQASNALEGPNSAIITSDLAKTLFGSQDAVGQRVTLNDGSEAVVRGVVELPKGKLSQLRFDMLLSMATRDAQEGALADRVDDWSKTDLNSATYVLLPKGGSFSASDFNAALAHYGEQRADKGTFSVQFRARNISQWYEDSMQSVLGMLLGLGSSIPVMPLFFVPSLLILGLACFNYMNLATALAASRAKEVGMRKILGARSGQIQQQYLVESLMTVFVSLVLAVTGVGLVLAAIRTQLGLDIGLFQTTGTGFWIALAALLLVVGLIAGLYPAAVMSRFRPIFTLRPGVAKLGRGHLRNLFILVQFMAASVLLTSAIVMFVQNGIARGEGYALASDPFVGISANLRQEGIDPEALRSALMSDPRIKGVTGAQASPWQVSVDSDIFSLTPGGDGPVLRMQFRAISYDFFSTLGVPMLAGREFARERDIDLAPRAGKAASPSGLPPLIIDLAAARQFGWEQAGDALGQIVYRRNGASDTEKLDPYRIIGVVKSPPLQLVQTGVKATTYSLDSHDTLPIVRIDPQDVQGALMHIDTVWKQFSTHLGRTPRFFIDDTFAENALELQMLTYGLVALVFFAFLVALSGLFGMAVFIAGQRRNEIGIRKTMGATASRVTRMLIWDFSKPVLIANLLAWPLAYLLVQVYLNLFVTRVALSPLPFIASLAITVAIAWMAVGGQALRAARVKPALVLKYE